MLVNGFNPGFRLSILDIVILAVATAISIACYPISPLASSAIIFVIAHFFLFCNVIRMSRISELIWASIFLSLSALSIYLNYQIIVAAFVISFMSTLILVGLELKKPSYHGLFWQKINPSLLQWFEQKHKTN